MASTLWLSLCLVLFAHNLIELMNDRHQLSYKIVERGDVLFDADYDLNYLVCTPFRKIRQKSLLTHELTIQKVSARSFLNRSIASIEHNLNVTGLFGLSESFIFNEHVCFPTNKILLEEEGKPFNELLGKYLTQRIFIYSKEKQPNFYEMAYEKYDGLGSIYLRAYKQKVFGANSLLNAGCSNRAHQIHHDRFSCLNKCFVQAKMISGFYRLDDEGTFDLSEILQNRIVKREVRNEEEALNVHKELSTIATKRAGNCLKKCPERACFWEVVITLKIDHEYYRNHLQGEGKDKVDLQLNTYAAFYSMDDFYLQLFGLLALFTGTSVLRLLHALLSQTLPVVTRKIEPLLKNEKLLRIFRLTLRNLKHALTLLCLVLVLVQGLAKVNEFRFHSSHPNRTSSLNFSSEPFSVVICFPIESSIEDGKIKEGRNSEILRNFSFQSIEEDSRNLSKSKIKRIEILANNKQIKPKLSNEVLFKSSKFDDQPCLSRCFRADLDESYKKIPLAFFQIKFNTLYREIFLIERTQNFTSGLVNFRGLYYPQKVTKIYSKSSVKSNCRDYSREPNCDSRRNCLDRCLSTKFIEKHGSIPTNTIVSSSHLNSTWLKESIYFNETVDTAIEKECSDDFNQTDCNEIYFQESPELANSEVNLFIFFRLGYLNIVEREMEYDPLKTLLDIIGLETVLFGSNALGVLTTILLFLCRTFRLKWRKAYSVFLLLLASAGFLAHNVLVFRTIISGDLQENEFFEKPERYTLPSPILCFLNEKEVDENHRVTGEYLDELTAHLTFQRAFWKIGYNNRTHWKELDIDKLKPTKSSTFYSSPELELSHFYYLGAKCLKTNLKVSYREEDFFLLTHKSVLSIKLNMTFANEMKYAIFLHQQADSRELGGGFDYNISESKPDHHGSVHYYYSYMIEFELFRIVREDQFELLKDPRRLFHEKVKVNDARTDETIRRRFEKDHKRTSYHLPLDGHFDLEVDNELYEQHVKTVIDQSPFPSLDFEQKVANIYTNVYQSPAQKDPHFYFSFSFLVRRVVITNRENYTKLVVSLLNTLSLWLDICVVDIGAWFSPLFKLALHFYRLLVNTKNRLERENDLL